MSFVCEKVAAKTSPDRILSDIAMVSDLGWPMRRSGSAVVAKDIGSSGTSQVWRTCVALLNNLFRPTPPLPESTTSSFQILDEDAEVFVVKMWRLLIYESEAKKLGLVVPRSSQ